MAESLEQLVALARGRLKRCGILKIWGSPVFRPGDVIYEVRAIALEGTTLRISLFQALDQSTEEIVIEGAARAKLGESGLKIRDASSIRGFGQQWSPQAGSGAALVLE